MNAASFIIIILIASLGILFPDLAQNPEYLTKLLNINSKVI